LGEGLREERVKEREHVKSILTPEEFLEYQKELEGTKELRIRIVGQYDKDEIEKLEAAAQQNAAEFLSRYADKKFCISKEFYDYGMNCLYDTFRWSRELPIIGVFRPENGKMVVKRFIDSDWLIKNNYARSSLGSGLVMDNLETGQKYRSFTSTVGWDSEKIEVLEKEASQSGECLIRFHSHPGSVFPSDTDVKVSGVIGVIGFENSSKELNQLALDSLESSMPRHPRWKEVRRTPEELIRDIENSDQPSYRKKIELDRVKRFYPDGQTVHVLQPYEVDSNLWNRICNECHPTIGLFVNLTKEQSRSIPLYINGDPLRYPVQYKSLQN
jgi:hypothetical protein